MKRPLLPLVLVASFLYRLLFLGRRQLWTDELMQALVARASSAAEMIQTLRDGMALPAPLDYFIQKGFVSILGETPWGLRVHAAVFGTLSIWIFHRIARQLVAERVAVYSTILLAFYPLHHHYSQEGRPYALFLFLALLSYDLLISILREPDRGLGRWIALAAVLVVLLYSSLLGAFVIFSQAMALAIVLVWGRAPAAEAAGAAAPDAATPREPGDLPRPRSGDVLKYAAVSLVAVLLFVPWLRHTWRAPHVASASEIADPRIVLRIVKELGDNSYPMTALLVVGVATGVRALRRHGRRNLLLWLAVWSVASIVPILAVELWSGYFFAIRHILHVTPALVLAAGYGISYVGERLRVLEHLPYRTSAPAIAYAALLAVISVVIAERHSRSEPVDWRGTALYLKGTLQPGDTVAMPEINALLGYYAPELESFRSDDLDPGPGRLGGEGAGRRYVVCLTSLSPDPCAGFRTAAARDPSWRRREMRGFSLWVREKLPAR